MYLDKNVTDLKCFCFIMIVLTLTFVFYKCKCFKLSDIKCIGFEIHTSKFLFITNKLFSEYCVKLTPNNVIYDIISFICLINI